VVGKLASSVRRMKILQDAKIHFPTYTIYQNNNGILCKLARMKIH